MLVVVKIGGDLVKEGLSQNLVDDITATHKKHRIMIVHGGADVVTEISTKLGHPPHFVTSPKGFKSRYTDREESIIYTMVMAGLINKKIVAALEGKGITSMGLSGIDCHIIKAVRKTQLVIKDETGRKKLIEGGYTGKITAINTEMLHQLLEEKILPVISPVAIGEESELLNVDGDRVSSSIASALKADRLIILTDTPGVKLNDVYVPKMSIYEAETALNKITGGMVTKLYSTIEAIKHGVTEAQIASGLSEKPISKALSRENCTTITK
jgi:acetylglutamate/LysW-gamma-L-alpha-aminoadipate kinase